MSKDLTLQPIDCRPIVLTPLFILGLVTPKGGRNKFTFSLEIFSIISFVDSNSVITSLVLIKPKLFS